MRTSRRGSMLVVLAACGGGSGGDPIDGAGADAPPFVPTGAVIDFASTSAAFPPTVNKIGFNSFWNAIDNDDGFDAWVIRRSAAFRAPMIAGLIEPKTLTNVAYAPPDTGIYADAYEEFPRKQSAAELDATGAALWQPGYRAELFYDNAGRVEARTPTDPDLAAIRATAHAAGLINFLQISGTPGRVPPSGAPSTTLDNGLFVLNGAPTTGGNWYPLPAAADYPALGHAFATLPAALGGTTSTIYGFWQEPSHTLSEAISPGTSIGRYTGFYAEVASQMAAACGARPCPIGGAQLNANDGDATPHDGAHYAMFMDALRARRAASPGTPIPLDYFTIQNYAAQWNDNVFANARVALGTDSPWTPVLMNEWDYCVNTRTDDGCTPASNTFSKRYDEPGAWRALHYLRDTLVQPDLSHVLLREKVLRDRDPDTGVHSYPWIQVPILFLASMSELRRPVALDDPALPILASGDPDQLTIIAWNEGATARPLALSLVGLPPALVGTTLVMKRWSAAIRDARCPGADVMDPQYVITCWDDAAAPVVLAADLNLPALSVEAGEVVMISAGRHPAYQSTTFADRYLRAQLHVSRDGTDAAPRATGHVDPRTGSITVGVQAGGAGAARVRLRDAPTTLPLRVRLAAAGGLRAEAAVAGVRVDYLDDAGAVISSVVHRDGRWPTAAAPWSALDWPLATAQREVATDLCGRGCDRTDGEGEEVIIDLAANAPTGWGADRAIDLGVFLAGADGDAIYRVDLP